MRSAALIELVAALILLSIVPLAGQENGTSAAVHGTIRDAQGNPVASATVSLQRKSSAETKSIASDAKGNYAFADLAEGVYSLHATKSHAGAADVESVFLAAHEAKTLDVTLSQPLSAPQFFDQPQFTVSGVTDTTSLGGHGSDTVVRTRDSIAKETASLTKADTATSRDSVAVESALRKEVENAPDSFDANHLLGQLLLQTGRAREAIPYLQRAAQASSGDYDNAYDLARANAAAGNYDRARDDVRTLLARHDKPELHHLLAEIEEKLGNSLEAVHQYQRAAEMDPSETYLFDWGSELLLHHAPEPAAQVFTQGNQLFPRSARMLMGLGAASFARGANDQAVRQLCAASDLNPNDPAPYVFLGKIEHAEKIPSDEVIEKLQRFVTLQPQNAEAHYYFAVASWKHRDPQDKARASQVESQLDAAIRLNPNFAAAELQLGIVHADQGDYSAAIPHYERAIQITPQTEEAHYRLSQAYRQTGQTEKARAELQTYEQLSKASAQKLEQERHEIRQFVYTLRDQPSSQTPPR